MDRQSEAYREATDEDHWDHQLGTIPGSEHYDPVTDPVRELRLPEDYESEEWDDNKDRPKSLQEARIALAQRIQDPEAPDGPESEGAYDDDED